MTGPETTTTTTGAPRDGKPSTATYDVAIVGAGYVGVPLAQVFAEAGRRVVLVEADAQRVEKLRRGESYIEDVSSEALATLVAEHSLGATTDYDILRDVDAILIALPTPLSRQREPDLSIVLESGAEIGSGSGPATSSSSSRRRTPAPRATRCFPCSSIASGLVAGKDFHLAFSPERVDPGRTDYTTKTVPKIVGGIDEASTDAAAALYGSAVDTVHRVSSPEAAELTKLLENIFRSVNIALVNELAQLCDRMGIDIWEVVDAAATKPFGFMPFQPGPGLGGHCIPIDPFYLTWKAREFDFQTRFIELAGEVNQNMPYYCRSRVSQALNHGAQKSLSGSSVLVLGVAYKADISDWRESPAVKLIELLQNAGASVAYHDPHVPALHDRRDRPRVRAVRSGRLRRRRDRDGALGDRLREARRRRVARRRPPERDRPRGRHERQGLEALTRVAHAGVGGWGRNVARVVGELADLAWICDIDEERRAQYAARYPQARVTAAFDDLLADDTVDAVVIATPVPTHHALAKQALEAGKHVFVEKPPAMRGGEMEELVALAEEHDLVLMPGHLLLYHPGLRKVKELVDGGELGEVACVYGNRQNLGVIRSNENALLSLGVHDLSVILWLLGEEPSEAVAHGMDYLQDGIEDVVFCFLRFPSGKVAHMHLSWLDPHKMRKMTVVGREKMVVFDDMELERKVTVYEKAPWEPAETYGEWRTRTGDIYSPKVSTDEPLKLELQHFLRLVAEGPGDHREARDGLAVVRTLDRLTESLRSTQG